MPAIHPPTRAGYDNQRTVFPQDEEEQSTSDRSHSARTLAWERTRGWKKLLPEADIANCIAFSKLRCIITLVSLVLFITDIPRTGLGVRNLLAHYPFPLMPSTAVRFGPFNYPVLHIWRRDNGSDSGAFAGLKGTQPIAAARVWSYQYDTTSVGLRGAVDLLNVSEFPSVLLYKPLPGQSATNASSLIDLSTVFTMLDGFITASQNYLRPTINHPTMLRYATKHNWIDRLHHYIVRFATKNAAWRLHSLHAPHISKDTLAICSNSGIGQRSSPHPRFCNHPGIWKCKHPLNASLPDVRLWDHMDLRLQSLQQQYPDLRLQVAVVSSQRLSSTLGAMRSTFYNYEALEIIVLTRGRRCVASSGANVATCTTVFVDDYRYERDIVQTNLVDWYGIISVLRGGAQAYVWVRVLLLGYGAYTAASRSNSLLVSMASIVFKIPFQVIVYSSLLPVSAYVGALVLDSSFTDIFLDSYWASVGGAVNFQWFPFIQTTSVQMRCVWLLALFASVVLFAMRRSRYYDDGIPGIRGLLIGFTSSLTVFGPYKSIYYRDMDITSIFRVPDEGPTMDVVHSSNPGDYFNSSSNGRWQTSEADHRFNRYQSHSARTLTWERTRKWHKLLPQPDIHSSVVLSKLRCIITLVSLVLLMTDIPRTGLGVRNLQEYYPIPLMPSTAVRFGPFSYPVVHIWRRGNESGSDGDGTRDSSAQFQRGKEAARVWSYQYDTTSVGLRGAVALLNVSKFPAFLLYKPQQNQPATNADSFLPLNATFTMLDAFIAAAVSQLSREDNTTSATLRYATKHNWVDRIHHYVVSFASKNEAWRLHSLHAPHISKDTLAICSNSGIGQRSSPHPRFCNHPGIWKCKHPLNASLPDVRLWDHMDLRLQSLQQQYPDLRLQVAVVSSQRLSSTLGAMRSTFYNYEALEIIVLTRGRRCVASSGANVATCTTVFVDDYRYERDIVQTNLIDWYGIISMLRGGAQTYVWVRLALLTYGAYIAAGRRVEGKSTSDSRWVSTAKIVLKIPFQVIVYSSLLPVSLYVAALVLDSSFMDIFLDSYWASVAGSVNFELVPFLNTTAVQMRNVWLLALLGFLVVFVTRKTRSHWHDGVPGIRGLLISFTSTLTICGPYKKATLRDTNITSVFPIADEGSIMDIIHCSPSGYMNSSSYIFDDSATMLLFCIGAVVTLAMIIKAFGSLTPRSSWIHRETEGVVLSSTPIVPTGARSLWPTSVLTIRFHAATRSQMPRQGASRPQVAASLTIDMLPSPSRQVWRFSLAANGNLRRGVHCYSTEYRSIIQLMNIAMMTDPWSLLWLRVLGIQLYLYKIHNDVSSTRSTSYAVILPFREDEMEEYTGMSSGDYQLLDSANSRDVPMSVLLQCG
ncbi:hypothetical protein C6341_g3502 [Phytophthora cactorum]|nr:hypothetical protein C6341_g3502 [Phytophthora cactorum]